MNTHSQRNHAALGMVKSAVLGFKGLTGNTHFVKDMIRLMRSKGVEISRVRPFSEAAQSINTGSLPYGVSSFIRRGIPKNRPGPFNEADWTEHIQVGKGLPRQNLHINTDPITNKPVSYAWRPGAVGGTNPSPISSFFHESGHQLHQQAMRRIFAEAPNKFGPNASWVTKEHGLHHIPDNPRLSTVLDELGANNSALRFMKQRGASEDATKFYKLMRRDSFNTYLNHLKPEHSSDLQQRVIAEGSKGYTPDLMTAGMYLK